MGLRDEKWYPGRTFKRRKVVRKDRNYEGKYIEKDRSRIERAEKRRVTEKGEYKQPTRWYLKEGVRCKMDHGMYYSNANPATEGYRGEEFDCNACSKVIST